jgi:ABC-type nitrate/sulfonate/bicarbonate transport system substrate-binding protein
MPLTDAAPLIIAQERGFFTRHGVRIELVRHTAWAGLRDRIAFDALDGAQMLAPMPLALSLGLGGPQRAVSVVSTLSRNGNTIVFSRALLADVVEAAGDAGASLPRPLPAAAFAAGLAHRAAAGRKPPIFAVVFPFSSHNYLLRHWLASAGLVPERDVRFIVLPPSQVGEQLAGGMIDGFCAGEPWGSRAVELGVGHVALTSADIWPGHPEKVLAFPNEQETGPVVAVIAALIEAGRWADDPANRDETVQLLCRHALPEVPPSVVAMALDGNLAFEPDGKLHPVSRVVFADGTASYPAAQDGVWYHEQMRRWGHLPAGTQAGGDPVPNLWRADLWSEAAGRLGIAAPAADAAALPPGATP